LYVDEKAYADKICTAYNESINLAVYVAYPTHDTIKLLLGKAYIDSKALAISRSILTDETTAEIIQKAHLEMLSLSNRLPDEALSDELKAEKIHEAAAVHEEKPHKPEEKQKEEKQEDAAAGLGSLFG